jgi:hypothetical protein
VRAGLASVLLVVTFGAFGSADRTPELRQRFRSRAYGYTLQLPKGWSAISATRRLDDGEPPATAGGGVDIFAVHPNQRVSVMSSPALVIGAQAVPASVTQASWEKQVTKTVDFMKGCPKPDRRERMTVDGVVAAVLVYDDCPKPLDYFHLWVAIERHGVGYHIVLFDHQGHEQADRATLSRALRSMRFTT